MSHAALVMGGFGALRRRETSFFYAPSLHVISFTYFELVFLAGSLCQHKYQISRSVWKAVSSVSFHITATQFSQRCMDAAPLQPSCSLVPVGNGGLQNTHPPSSLTEWQLDGSKRKLTNINTN